MIYINSYRFAVASAGTAVTYGTGVGTGTFVQSPTGIWGTGGPIHAVGTPTLASGGNGRYQADYLATNNRNAVLGYDSDATNNSYLLWPIGIYVSSVNGNYYYISAGSGVNSGVAAAINDKYGCNRTGGLSPVYTVGYLRGGIWTDIFTYTAYAGINIILYPKGHLESTSTYISNPRIV